MWQGVLDGGWIDPKFVKECADQVRAKGEYQPRYMLVSRKTFNRIISSISAFRQMEHIIHGYREAGIVYLVWAQDIKKDGEFYLSSGEGIDPGVETLVINKEADRASRS